MQILLLFWYNFEAGERSCDWTARGVLLCFIYICGIDNILLYLQSLWNAIEDDDKCAFPLHLVFPYISSGSQLFSMIDHMKINTDNMNYVENNTKNFLNHSLYDTLEKLYSEEFHNYKWFNYKEKQTFFKKLNSS